MGTEIVLVTGGAHFVGYHIVQKIVEAEPLWHIAVLDGASPLPRLPSVTYFDVDITNQKDVRAAIQQVKPTLIFHAACTYSLSLPAATFHAINVQGTKNVVEAAQSLNGTVKALIYHSSSSVVETGTSSVINASESSPVLFAPDQKFPYPLSKALAEKHVLDANGKYGMLTASIRPAGTFGEADTETMKALLAMANAGRANFQLGDGKNIYDFVYVGNLVHAHLLLARALLDSSQRDEGKKVDGEAFQVTDGNPRFFWDFTRAVAKEAGYPVKQEDIRALPRWLAMIIAFFTEWIVWIISAGKNQAKMTRSGVRYSCINRTFNIDKARKRLGYRPIFSTQEGLEKSVKWFKENGKNIYGE